MGSGSERRRAHGSAPGLLAPPGGGLAAHAGNQNLSRFRLKAFDEIHDKLAVLPDGPERLARFDKAKKIALAYAPYKLRCYRFVADMMHPMVVGYRRPLFWNEWWHMEDADPAPRVSAAL